ncbi:MAG: hypothetical protein ACREV2_03420, partial [Burkholderiales bacterium]
MIANGSFAKRVSPFVKITGKSKGKCDANGPPTCVSFRASFGLSIARQSASLPNSFITFKEWTMNEQLNELLFQMLETEMGGVQVY